MEEKELLMGCYESKCTPLGYFIGWEDGFADVSILRVGFVGRWFLSELLTPIERFDSDFSPRFSPRTKNCLKKLNILCLGDLVQRTHADLLQERNVGHQTIEELQAFLKEIGLQFGLCFSPSLKQAFDTERKRKD